MSEQPTGAPKLECERVFVTGSSGFVGRHLVPALRRSLPPGAQIAVGAHDPAAPDGCRVFAIDLGDASTVERAIAAFRPNLVIHLAGQASVAAAGGTAGQTWQVNACGTLALARAIADHCPTATTLFASSAEVYGLAFNDGIVDEETLPIPRSVYACSKLAAEQMLRQVLDPAASLIIARPSNHIGPGQAAHFALPSFAAQIADAEASPGDAVVRVGNLDSMRDFLDVRDVVAAYLEMLSSPALRGRQSVLNVSAGNSHRLGTLLEMLIACSGRPVEIITDPDRTRPAEIREARVDATKLRRLLGWEPRHELVDTVTSVLADARARRADHPKLPTSS